MTIIEFLLEDHRKVDDLFARFDQGEDTSAAVTAALTNHDKIEMNILYPAVESDVPDLGEELQHAKEEHSEIRSLLDRVSGASAAHDEDAKKAAMSDLKECVQHHVAEEESTLFPEIDEKMDSSKLKQLGDEARASKF